MILERREHLTHTHVRCLNAKTTDALQFQDLGVRSHLWLVFELFLPGVLDLLNLLVDETWCTISRCSSSGAQLLALTGGAFCILLFQFRDRGHAAMLFLAAQPAKKGTFEPAGRTSPAAAHGRPECSWDE